MSVRAFDCPSCGAPVKFESSIAVSAVCEFCRSIVVHRGANVETLGVMAELPPDLTPLQPGTRGEWQGKRFQIIGRLRVTWEDGSWNEWCAEFGDGQQGWVAEAQGFLMVSFRQEVDGLPTDPKAMKAGAQLQLGGRAWSIVDIKEVHCQSGEGQLPFEVSVEWHRTSVDLTSRDGVFGSLEYDDEGASFYVGGYARYPELALENLRPVPGWSAEVETTRNKSATLGCPSCGAAVTLRAAGQTMAAVCGSCGSVIDTANPHLQLIQKADRRVKDLQLQLPIGQRGKLFDVEYEVVGFVARKDNYSCTWYEYLLFNPWHGFDWLVNYRGHWSFARRVMDLPNLDGSHVQYQQRSYSLFAKAEASVVGVLGEFYWKVKRGERAILHDWVQPPFVLSKESYHDLQEFTWSHGVYVEPEVVRDGFGLKTIPSPLGAYLNKPNPYQERWHSIRGYAFLFLGLYVLVQLLFAARVVKTPVYEGNFVFDRTQLEIQKVATSPKFEIKGGHQPVWFEATAFVQNAWIGFDIDLVNAKTNETLTLPLTVEYYYGNEGGESWSEGSQQESDVLAGVPSGEYFLNIDVDADPTVSQLPYRITVRRGGVFWSNFWTGFLLLLAYPGWLYYRCRQFEVARWSESDFSLTPPTTTTNETSIYLMTGVLTCLYLTTSNLRGWSLWQTLSPARWGARGSSGFHHK